MIQPCIVDGQAFVGCLSRLGEVNRRGPVTGEMCHIIPTGSWIDEDDAAVLCDTQEEIFCFRVNGIIKTFVVFYLVPDERQYKERHSG